MPRDSIKNYDVDSNEMLGKGGFACVYKATCLQTGQSRAIKMIDKGKLNSATMKNRVQNEVKIHSRLMHPSVVKLHSFFEDDSYIYLVLDYCENGDLNQFLKNLKRSLTEEETKKIVKQIVEGLIYLHAHSIIHRDLSLSNILLTRKFQIKISDFGLAIQLDTPQDKRYTLCGTPNFLSPEVAGQQAHGLESDLWSLGCIIYICLVGSAPFDTCNLEKTLQKVQSGQFQIPSSVSPNATHLIHALLQKNPQNRLSLKSILEHPFMTLTPSSGASSASSGVGADCSSATGSFFDSSVDSGNFSQNSSSGFCLAGRKQSSANHRLSPVNESYDDTSANRKPPVPSANVPNQQQYSSLVSCSPSFATFSFTSRATNLPSSIRKLTSQRLKPFKQKTLHAIFEILEKSSNVLLQFYKNDSIIEFFEISSDGETITISKPQAPLKLANFHGDCSSISFSSKMTFSFDALPQKHFKKYSYALRFVDMIKSKSPKIILYKNESIKAVLMESLSDFEFEFLTTNEKIILSPSVTKYFRNGTLSPNHIVEEDHACFAMKNDLLTLHQALVSSFDETQLFPAIFGKRPSPGSTMSHPPAVATTTTTSSSIKSIVSSEQPSSIGSTKNRIKIDGIGEIEEKENKDDLEIHFIDGNKLEISSRGFRFIEKMAPDSNYSVAKSFHFENTNSKNIPPFIKRKLMLLPQILSSMQSSKTHSRF